VNSNMNDDYYIINNRLWGIRTNVKSILRRTVKKCKYGYIEYIFYIDDLINRLVVTVNTWNRDSYGLYDYECNTTVE